MILGLLTVKPDAIAIVAHHLLFTGVTYSRKRA
jgi:hypothetical protein